ncbi:U-box domain-containing protein 33-like isoform X1 [Hordeum vulgare subsp. vulgare]|uniref:RING-type E3 ubiquitin transferase n=2 Tax=Hordeum vulgare subsp. vulgare TaxID=112509 RepID=A0A8I6Z8Z6_HORVV|nr:U-box domain-containing protein 33-like isoform X1 [Hordeum vulgare subsp. vulgare]
MEEEEVYCAVGKEQWNWKANLRWVLANFPGRRLVLAHVHRPPHRINMMGAWVPASQVGAAMVAACRKWEEDEASEALDHLLHICKAHRVDARKLIVSGDDLPGGLVRLVADHGVAELVMGAAADRAYSRKMRAPKSKKAAAVKLMANPSCRIWFVCKGKLICTREASDEGLMSRGEPSTASTSPRPTASDDGSTSKSSSSRHGGGGAEPAGMECQRDKSFLDGEKSVRSDQGDASEMEDQQTRRPPEAAEEPMPAAVDGDQGVDFLRLGLPELEEATGRFDESARIGSAGIGRAGVYRGSLRGMSVAVTVISPDVAVGEARFAREVEAIAKVRHPGLVQLVGACPEARAVVHELVPGGSLEDRLEQGGDGTPPLPWLARCRVAYQVCTALAFLHSSAKTVHGDVRPANILLLDDEEHRPSGSKLADLGVRGLMAQAEQQRAGREALAYVDKRYLATGEPTPQSDVHALGLLLLRLVTGLPARWAKKAALEANAGRGRSWHQVVDASAGGWPTELATEVALLGLRCCAVSDGRTPCRPAGELLEEARAVLEAAMDAAPGRTWSSSLLSSSEKEASNGGVARLVLLHLPDNNQDQSNLRANSSRSIR